VAARVVRRSLKEDKRLAAERRGEMDLRMAKWEVRVALGLVVSVRVQFRAERFTTGCLEDVRLMCMQNGKQGEVKSVETVNQQAMAEHAGQSSQ
jgi:hypothetical protein